MPGSGAIDFRQAAQFNLEFVQRRRRAGLAGRRAGEVAANRQISVGDSQHHRRVLDRFREQLVVGTHFRQAVGDQRIAHAKCRRQAIRRYAVRFCEQDIDADGRRSTRGKPGEELRHRVARPWPLTHACQALLVDGDNNGRRGRSHARPVRLIEIERTESHRGQRAGIGHQYERADEHAAHRHAEPAAAPGRQPPAPAGNGYGGGRRICCVLHGFTKRSLDRRRPPSRQRDACRG